MRGVFNTWRGPRSLGVGVWARGPGQELGSAPLGRHLLKAGQVELPQEGAPKDSSERSKIFLGTMPRHSMNAIAYIGVV